MKLLQNEKSRRKGSLKEEKVQKRICNQHHIIYNLLRTFYLQKKIQIKTIKEKHLSRIPVPRHR